MDGLVVCALCSIHQAQSFCICTDPYTLLCENCFTAHHQKNKTWQHFVYPIAALKYAKDPEYLTELHRRISFLPQIRLQTEKNLAEIAKCAKDFLEKTEQLINLLVTQAKEEARSLRQQSREIEESLIEIENKLTERDPELTTKYAAIMWEHLDSGSADFELFQYEIDCPQYPPLLHLKTRNEVECLCGLKIFPCISGQMLLLHDINGDEQTTIRLSETFTQGAVFCLLDSQSMLGVGGDPASASAYLINWKEGEVYNRSTMIGGRAFPGITKVEQHVYVFGGCSPDLLTCEKMDIESASWSACASMSRCRSRFTPCVYQHDIYLADYRSICRGLIEFFSIDSNTYTNIRFEIKYQRPYEDRKTFTSSLDNNEYSSSFIIDGTLMILANNQVRRWKMSSSYILEVVAFKGDISQGNSPPIVRGSNAFITQFDGEMLIFNCNTNTVYNLSRYEFKSYPHFSRDF